MVKKFDIRSAFLLSLVAFSAQASQVTIKNSMEPNKEVVGQLSPEELQALSSKGNQDSLNFANLLKDLTQADTITVNVNSEQGMQPLKVGESTFFELGISAPSYVIWTIKSHPAMEFSMQEQVGYRKSTVKVPARKQTTWKVDLAKEGKHSITSRLYLEILDDGKYLIGWYDLWGTIHDVHTESAEKVSEF